MAAVKTIRYLMKKPKYEQKQPLAKCYNKFEYKNEVR